MRTTLRQLTLDGRTYLWRTQHLHLSDARHPSACAERLTVYEEGFRRSPARILFPQGDGWEVGYPTAGALCRRGASLLYDLNRPAVVAALVREAIRAGWAPSTMTAPLIFADGFALLGNAPTGYGGM